MIGWFTWKEGVEKGLSGILCGINCLYAFKGKKEVKRNPMMSNAFLLSLPNLNIDLNDTISTLLSSSCVILYLVLSICKYDDHHCITWCGDKILGNPGWYFALTTLVQD